MSVRISWSSPPPPEAISHVRYMCLDPQRLCGSWRHLHAGGLSRDPAAAGRPPAGAQTSRRNQARSGKSRRRRPSLEVGRENRGSTAPAREHTPDMRLAEQTCPAPCLGHGAQHPAASGFLRRGPILPHRTVGSPSSSPSRRGPRPLPGRGSECPMEPGTPPAHSLHP
jgi:hypothetical protein